MPCFSYRLTMGNAFQAEELATQRNNGKTVIVYFLVVMIIIPCMRIVSISHTILFRYCHTIIRCVMIQNVPDLEDQAAANAALMDDPLAEMLPDLGEAY